MAKGKQSQSRAVVEENPVFQETLQNTMNLIVPEGYVEEQVSFPPYWKPELAKGFRGTVLYRDERVGNFHRYVIESATRLECRSGPVDDGVIIDVEPGQNFSIGVYAALPLDKFFGLEVAVICVGSRKLPPNDDSDGRPRDLWEFKLMVSPEVKALLKSQREEDIAYLKEAHRVAGRKMIEELAKSARTSKQL